ncbi:ASCH domain-containing protein [Ureibacillus acetophenoni]|uniref:Uncharacterized protein YhfF n=1 Tax=Ureibacillus acetophenoni TaxID=614649 RepID=A0A285UKZ6_9BACL|nr:ASCH domain-containing protein [Ureibacillus acetophenoni]SOC42529.1 uncharacterized protein YhfF [Ureibacillus acetophenoni]
MSKVDQFWYDYCVENNKEGLNYKEAFQFGSSADWLAEMVVEGKKTATTSGFLFYEIENAELPKAEEYYIVLDGRNEPVAVIEIQSVEVVPMNEVTEEFALAEGLDSYQYWWDAHEKFFTDALKEYNLAFSPEMLVVCERFRKVYPL